MKSNYKYQPINVEETLTLMPLWIKEKDKRYRKQKKLSEKLFGSVVKYIEQQQRKK